MGLCFGRYFMTFHTEAGFYLCRVIIFQVSTFIKFLYINTILYSAYILWYVPKCWWPLVRWFSILQIIYTYMIENRVQGRVWPFSVVFMHRHDQLKGLNVNINQYPTLWYGCWCHSFLCIPSGQEQCNVWQPLWHRTLTLNTHFVGNVNSVLTKVVCTTFSQF